MEDTEDTDIFDNFEDIFEDDTSNTKDIGEFKEVKAAVEDNIDDIDDSIASDKTGIKGIKAINDGADKGKHKDKADKKKPKVASKNIVFAPQKGPQTDFLMSSADIVIYGGSAGSGKTTGLILETIRNILVPGFNAVIFRRTSTHIRSAGGLWDESMQWYPHLKGKPNESRLKWKFQNSVEIQFRYLEHEKNKLDYMGSQICLLMFDELTHFSEATFFYMLSRNRSMCGVKPYVRCTCNADCDSWVATFISWWIGDDGFPIPERSGKIRWMLRVGDHIEWANTAEELVERFSSDRKDEWIVPKSVTFIASKVTDNKILMEKDPGYIANLLALPRVERARFLDGNWKIKTESGKFFNRNWFLGVTSVPEEGEECRFWDFAATKADKGKDPDYTVGVKMRKVENTFYIVDVIAMRENPAEVEKAFIKACRSDRKEAERVNRKYIVRWEEEGGASGKSESYRLTTMLQGYDARGIRARGSKETRARAVAVQAEAGNVKILNGAWNEHYLTTMHMFTDNASKHDDMVDGTSGAFNCLTTNYISPRFTLSQIDRGDKPKESEEDIENRRKEAYEKLEEAFILGEDFI